MTKEMMIKTAAFSVLAILIFWFANANFSLAPVDQVKEALEEGDAEALSGFLASNALVNIHEATPAETKQQSSEALAIFFDQYPPIRFVEKHRGQSKKNNHTFLIGELHAEGGTFRINILMTGDRIAKLDIEPVEAFL